MAYTIKELNDKALNLSGYYVDKGAASPYNKIRLCDVLHRDDGTAVLYDFKIEADRREHKAYTINDDIKADLLRQLTQAENNLGTFLTRECTRFGLKPDDGFNVVTRELNRQYLIKDPRLGESVINHFHQKGLFNQTERNEQLQSLHKNANSRMNVTQLYAELGKNLRSELSSYITDTEKRSSLRGEGRMSASRRQSFETVLEALNEYKKQMQPFEDAVYHSGAGYTYGNRVRPLEPEPFFKSKEETQTKAIKQLLNVIKTEITIIKKNHQAESFFSRFTKSKLAERLEKVVADFEKVIENNPNKAKLEIADVKAKTQAEYKAQMKTFTEKMTDYKQELNTTPTPKK